MNRHDGHSPASAVAAATVPLGALSAASFLVSADARMIDPLLPILAGEFGTDVGGAALVVTAYALPYGLLQLLYGPLGDRLGKLRVMAAAMVVFALGTGLCAVAPGLPALVLLRLATGVAAAALFPLALAHVGDSVPYAARQAAIGRLVGASALGQILSAGLGGLLGQFADWRALFALCGLAALPVAVLLRRAADRAPVPAVAGSGGLGAALGQYRPILRLPAARAVLLAVFLEGCCFFGAFAYVGASLRERYGLPFATIGLLLGGFGVGMLAASRALRPLVAALGERGLIGAGGALLAGGLLLLAAGPHPAVVAPLIVVMGAGFSLLHTTLQTRATELVPGARGTAIALFAFVVSVGQGTGAALLGRVVGAAGYGAVFALGGAVIGLLALRLVLARGRQAAPVGGDTPVGIARREA